MVYISRLNFKFLWPLSSVNAVQEGQQLPLIFGCEPRGEFRISLRLTFKTPPPPSLVIFRWTISPFYVFIDFGRILSRPFSRGSLILVASSSFEGSQSFETTPLFFRPFLPRFSQRFDLDREWVVHVSSPKDTQTSTKSV